MWQVLQKTLNGDIITQQTLHIKTQTHETKHKG